jgi:hypothetical protein
LTGKDIGAGPGAVQSLHKQIRRAEERLPEGFCISGWYWDIESDSTGRRHSHVPHAGPGLRPSRRLPPRFVIE